MYRGVGLRILALCCLLSLSLSAAAPRAESAAPAAVTAAVAASVDAAPAEALQATRLSIGVLGILSDAPYLLAKERGYLAEQGLDAEYQLFDSGARMVAPLGTGQLDVAPGSPSVGLYNAVSRGVVAKIVADWASGTPTNPTNFVVPRKDLLDSGAIRDWADFRGRKLAITALGTSLHVQAGRLAERGGFPLSELDLVEMGYGDMVPALAGRSVDATILVEPFVVQTVEQGSGVRWRTTDELVPGQVAATVMYGPNLLEQRPEVGNRFMVAYLKGLRDYYNTFIAKDPAVRDQIIPILMQITSYKDRALYDQVILPSVNPDGRVNVDALEADYRWYVSQGLIGDVVNLRSLVVNDYLDYALQQVGTYAR